MNTLMLMIPRCSMQAVNKDELPVHPWGIACQGDYILEDSVNFPLVPLMFVNQEALHPL